MNAATALAQAVVQSIDTGINDVLNPSIWPTSAEFAVQYQLKDKQFAQVRHEKEIRFFDNHTDLLHWLEERREWIKGTDFDFTMTYYVYEWDLGPTYKYHKTI